MITQYVKIPQDRIGVLIGSNGTIKEYMEKKSGSKIKIDSNEGDIRIEGGDSIKMRRVVEVIKAIGRGFSPEKAFKLLDDEFLIFDIITLSHLSPKTLKRVKGRIIGKNGKARMAIEDLADIKISVYGKTIGIIGYPHRVRIAHNAIEMLINGAPHSSIYSFLEKKRREVKDVF
jgi:ribosomal RNA assembly protein